MAINSSTNPVNTQAVVAGNVNTNNVLVDHIFSDLLMPDISKFVSYKYPQYTLTSFLDRLNMKEGTQNPNFSWFEYGFFRKQYVVGAGSTLAAAATITVKVLSTTVAAIGLVVGDQIRFESGQVGRITVIAQSTADVDLTVVNQSGNAWTSGGAYPVPTVLDKFAQSATAFGEYSDAPDSRIYNPTKLEQNLTIMRRTANISTNALAHKTWVEVNGKNSFYWIQEDIEMKQLAQDKEMQFMFGVQSASTMATGATQSGYGIIPRIQALGVNVTYTGAVSEDDVAEMVRLLQVNGNGDTSELTVLGGSRFMKDFTLALQKYFISGSISYGSFTESNSVGLNVTKYSFNGLTLNLIPYFMFDNPTLLPAPTRAANVDWSTAAVFLNMGSREGVPFLRERYLVDEMGTSYSFLRKVRPGISDPGAGLPNNISVSGKDGFSIDLYAQCGIEMRCPENFGLMYRA
jgi:hypothetical protein